MSVGLVVLVTTALLWERRPNAIFDDVDGGIESFDGVDLNEEDELKLELVVDSVLWS
jgi:hypothetical protein